jgi:nicotinamidase-related amidase
MAGRDACPTLNKSQLGAVLVKGRGAPGLDGDHDIGWHVFLCWTEQYRPRKNHDNQEAVIQSRRPGWGGWHKIESKGLPVKVINGVEVLTTVEELTDPTSTAVIVIDVLNVVLKKICSYEGQAAPKSGANTENLQRLVPPIRKIIDAARKRDIPIIYAEFIQRTLADEPTMDGPNLYCHRNADEVNEILEGSEEGKTVDELSPGPGDIIIHKTRGSAFYFTDLDEILRERGIRSLIHTGLLSSGCVLFNACDTMQRGYYPVIPRECIGTYDLEDHQRVMGWMQNKFPIFDLDEILTAWK